MRKWVVAIAILVLLIAHQDYWQWDRADLVWGFVPYNMAYHVCLSGVTALVWIIVCMTCWPKSEEVDFDDNADVAEDSP
ncbi:MAG: hypothetical protein ACR2NP_20695 [Pirellulaceae bacterium]